MPKTYKPQQPIIITNHGDTIAQALAPPDLPTYTIKDTEQAHTILTQHPHTTIHHLQTKEDTLTILTHNNHPTLLNWAFPNQQTPTTTLSLHDPHIQQKIHQHIQQPHKSRRGES